MRARWWWLPLAVMAPAVTQGQVVRGTVTQSTSGGAVAGALVELLARDSGHVRVASALSGGDGRFALQAPAAGRYVLTAKRIGVRRFASPPFALAEGEARQLDVVLQALDYRLPEVVVTATAPCAVNPADRARVASLWEEARTALDAAEISLRDRLFSAHVTRYVRELEPRTLRVLRESRSAVRGVVASPFAAPPAESLSALGYWQPAEGGGATYYGPDARVLLSDQFLVDHCFRPVTGRGNRRGMVGLAFEPVAGRPVPDVKGTLWMDARHYELQLVEFGYDRVRDGVDERLVGGEVHFARLPGGAWIVRRWHLRVPMMGRPAQPVATEGGAPWVLVRPSLVGLSEEGGEVTPDALRPTMAPGSVTGTVRDSGGRAPLAGATVRLGGTDRAAVTGSDGRFAFDSVPAGSLTLVVQAPGYDALGLVAADLSLELAGGESRRVTLTAHDARALTTRLCGGRAAPWGRGTLHVTVRDSALRTPRAGLGATVHWMSTVQRARGDSVPVLVEGTTDARGTVTFCEVPSDRALTVRVAHPQGGTLAPVTVTLRGREVRAVELTVGERPPTG